MNGVRILPVPPFYTNIPAKYETSSSNAFALSTVGVLFGGLYYLSLLFLCGSGVCLNG